MAIVIRAIAPVAHFPLILGVLRKLNVAPLVDTLIPPHPEHVLSCGRGVEALVLALLDGHQALYKVGPRLDERGMFPLLPPGLTRHSVHDTRLGQILDALFAANLPRGFGAIARKALETYAIATPWIPQDTTTLALYGAYEAAAETEAPRPAYGHHTAGRPDLKQGLRSLGVRGDGGLPRRMALCDGTTSESVDVRQAIQARLALGLDGVQGSVADSKASSQRTLGLCVAQHVGLVPWVPRTGALRQEVDAWGQPQRSLPLLIDKPGRRRQDAPRRWYGRSLTRQGEGEDADGRGGLEPIRVVAVYSTPLAPQHAQAYITAQTQAAEALAQPPLQVEARRFACAADAEAAIAAYTGSGQGRRGRRPCPWRSHMGHSQGQTEWRRKKRARRGRPAKTDQPAEERCDRRGVETKPLQPPVHTYGWLGLATTLRGATCGDAELGRVYRDQTTTGAPGFRWLKTPAAISPVWLETAERIAALAMLTVVGLLVYPLIQRQVRQYLQHQHQRVPGNQGETAMPTAAVVVILFAHVTMVHLELDAIEVRQVHGWQEHHRLVCDALGVDTSWYDMSAEQKNNPTSLLPP